LTKEDAMTQLKAALSSSIQYAQSAADINTKEPANWMQLGRVYESVLPLGVGGSDTFAIANYKKASDLSPFDPSPLLASARVQVQMKQTKEARASLEAVLAIKPDLAQAIFMLSQIEVQAGDLKAAITRTEQTAMLVPNDVGVLFQLGLLYYQNGNFDYSRLALERVVALSPSYANARYFLGLIYDKAGLKDKAIEQFKNIEQTNPDNQEVKKILQNLSENKAALTGISPTSEVPVPEKKDTKLKLKKK